ncbi:glycosyltransferase family 39 protein [Cellulophaga sp. HaHaR_3_176]|uniref:ArnT family glycosyltransferase n=1 Tax=Cellulophaga sp. HaHaR_3_176 TaxID=1942464 RepID=UPI001C1FE1CC|nr:glycosyltransferase family 39 protein [Cellulophaga sp. HaHaR_3_176]QWX85364.1 glycosyltransferase family 39 protein [Cellulophaga sp. HaHaR_3_176]
MLQKIKFNSLYFIVFFTILNLIQVSFTELTSDEAYYWFYSLKLDWGYYDHPPMVGFLTYLGGLFFNSELGVRVFHVLTISVGLFFLFKLLSEKEKIYAAVIILALPLFNYISFIIFPDTALVGATALILYGYKNFIDKNNIPTALLLGFYFSIALYSKYHAVLFIFFIVLSNIKLLTNKYFYISILTASILFLPHLYWQYVHDFVTFKYHLIGRSSSFKLKFFTEFLGTQIGIIGLAVIFIPFIYKPVNTFEKSLKYIALGTFVFFAFSSLRGYVHLHWTSIALIPIIIMGAKFYSSRKSNKLFTYLTTPFIGLLLIIRLYFMFNIFGVNNLNVDYYHEHPLWAEDINTIADTTPVVFNTGNSGLRDAPMYTFYSNKFATALFPGEHKKSQYQVLNYEDSIQNKTITYIEYNNKSNGTLVKSRMGKKFYHQKIENFKSFTNIIIESEFKQDPQQENFLVTLKIKNHRNNALIFSKEQKLYINFEDEKGFIKQKSINLSEITNIKPTSERVISIPVEKEFLPTNTYSYIIGFTNKLTSLNSVNSERKKIMVK